MAIIKCKMCGGDLSITADVTVAECEYCGTKQTVPTADNEKKLTLFARANRLRAACEFDKAAGIYESIVAEFPEEAEAYWGLVLCQYGIEYVDDPATGKKIPTCHRSSFESVMEDSNFEQAMENADESALRVYRDEAKTIERIRKGILEVSSSEQPYDIFICYKETDSHGDRTVDSLLAQNIYDALTDKGYRVFFSRITLEDKLGMAYEPYIFAALNSAKIMLAVGTCYEHYNAVWVKNEWSRFLKMMTQSKGKYLIPCYKNIDPYDIPKEFSHLQGQDMGKVGAIQDLLRGIEKIIPKDKPKETIKETVVVQTDNADIAPLLKRAFMFLEDGDWHSAEEYCEKVLDKDPECAEAYLGKLMAELRVRKQADLRNQREPFDGNANYQKVVRFGTVELKVALAEAIKFIKERNEKARIEGIYTTAVKMAETAKTEADFKAAAAELQRISHYKDSAELNKKYLEKAEECRKDAIYNDAKATANKNTIKDCEAAIKKFQSIPGWKDADEQIALCNQKIEELKRKAEADRNAAVQRAKKTKKIAAICAAAVIVIIAAALVTTKVIIPNGKYNDALALMEAGQYEEAIASFEAMDGYKDCDKQIEVCEIAILDASYADAIALMNNGMYKEAISVFEALDGYSNSSEIIMEYKYNAAIDLLSAEQYAEAIVLLETLGEYKDSPLKIAEAHEMMRRILLPSTFAVGGEHIVALKSDGTAVAAGNNEYGQCDVTNWKNISSVAAGYNFTVGLKSDGTVVTEGLATYGVGKREKCDVDGWKDIVQVSADMDHVAGLKSDGTVVATGNNSDGQCEVSSWKNIVQVSCGSNFTVGLKSDGTVVVTGNHSDIKVNGWRDIVRIDAGFSTVVGLKGDGTVVATGWNDSGQCDVSKWKNIFSICAETINTYGIKEDGTVVAAGNTTYGQADISGWRDILALDGGSYYTVGLKSDGTLKVTGEMYNDKLGVLRKVASWTDIMLPNK